MTGACGATAFVASATPYGVLPNLVWKSMPPSPVKTRSASTARSLSLVNSTTRSIPRAISELVKAIRPVPRPPAAPAPGRCSRSRWRSRLMTSAYWCRFRSRMLTISGVAPFCGPNTAEAPSFPVRGLVTSDAINTWVAWIRGSKSRTSIRASRSRAPPPSGSSFPLASSKWAPSAWAIPAPPSLVAEPPIPRIIFLTPWFSASSINSPVP